MVTFLFWNLNGKPLQDLISRLALRHGVDIVMLSECAIPVPVLLKTLNGESDVSYQYSPGIGCKRIKLFVRFPKRFIEPISEGERLTIRHLKLPGKTDILLAINHFPSKLNWDSSSQVFESVKLAECIRESESRTGHSRTILVGDLNMNPFENGVVAANGLHGVMSRSIAQKGQRIVQGTSYPFFYNPMWSLLGDFSHGPPGTYYQWRAEHRVFFWNTFDQLLIRPDLLNAFSNDSLQVIESDGTTSFLSRDGTPDRSVASDHLPLLFRLGL